MNGRQKEDIFANKKSGYQQFSFFTQNPANTSDQSWLSQRSRQRTSPPFISWFGQETWGAVKNKTMTHSHIQGTEHLPYSSNLLHFAHTPAPKSIELQGPLSPLLEASEEAENTKEAISKVEQDAAAHKSSQFKFSKKHIFRSDMARPSAESIQIQKAVIADYPWLRDEDGKLVTLQLSPSRFKK